MNAGYYAGLFGSITSVLLGAFVHPGFAIPVLIVALVAAYLNRSTFEALPEAQAEFAVGPASITLGALFTPWFLLPWAVSVICLGVVIEHLARRVPDELY